VEVSTDNGATWQATELGPDIGRFAFRSWSYRFTSRAAGKHTLVVRASNAIGQTQTENLIFNLQSGRLSQQRRAVDSDYRGVKAAPLVDS